MKDTLSSSKADEKTSVPSKPDPSAHERDKVYPEKRKRTDSVLVDQLCYLFQKKCKVSDSVNSSLSNLSFQDPGHDDLSSVFSKLNVKEDRQIDRESDQSFTGGMVKDSSLSRAIKTRIQGGRNLIILPEEFVDGSLRGQKAASDKTDTGSETYRVSLSASSPVDSSEMENPFKSRFQSDAPNDVDVVKLGKVRRIIDPVTVHGYPIV